MGEVYLAGDKRLHRKIAPKLLLAQFAQNEDRTRHTSRRTAPLQPSTIQASSSLLESVQTQTTRP